MKILCTQTNRNRLCDGCGDTASDNRCRACLDESRGIPGPLVGKEYQDAIACDDWLDREDKHPLTFASWGIACGKGAKDGDRSVIGIAGEDLQKGDLVVAPIEIEDDLPDVYSGDAGLAKMKEKLCEKVRSTYQDIEVIEEGLLKSNQDIIDDMLAAIKVSPSAVYSYETFADIEPTSLSSRCASLPYIEPLYSKELPTKPGVYKVRCINNSIPVEEEGVRVCTAQYHDGFLVVFSREVQPLDMFCKMFDSIEWLFVRDIEPLYSKEAPKPGVYSVRYMFLGNIQKTMEVTVERFNDISFIVKAPGLQMPLDVFCKTIDNTEWLFIRDLGT